ncbi:hypothetical protein [Streptacidiphilus sp. P02-A3a]|uniref:hypothetical protein n=1 Tax=Streptacidiphilus sp. P02-A3a TaxID=2704468 RepID=UPI0015FE5F1C|nr:hypothetical protein [Streptacidiphilus sp. P02-A3a]QMU70178.1 hypothetical protein GXP74_20050 [Streptacidiphilus sp. P02-A3a]
MSTTSSRPPTPVFSAMSQPVGVGSRSRLSGSPDSTARSVSSAWTFRKNWRTRIGSDSATVLACGTNCAGSHGPYSTSTSSTSHSICLRSLGFKDKPSHENHPSVPPVDEEVPGRA